MLFSKVTCKDCLVDYSEDAVDEAAEKWGTASGSNPPFYRFLYYPDVLDLRRCGYEIDQFAPLLDLLDGAHTRHAQVAHTLLHLPSDRGGNVLWNPRRARELEFNVRAALHRFGLSDVPTLLRRMIGKAFPGDSISHLSVDLLNVFFWAAMGKVARDYAWRSPQLEMMADYLEYPVRRAYGAAYLSPTADL